MPSHRTPAALLLFALVAAGTCSAIANAQEATFEFVESGQALGKSKSRAVALGDLDGDGDLDAVIANDNLPNTVWINDGTGTFNNSGQEIEDDFGKSVALGDLDGDGDLDAMFGNAFGLPNTVWTNDGNGTFTNTGQALGSSNSQSVALGDLDGDDDLDAVVGNNGQPNTVWTNDGNGTFTNTEKMPGGASSSVALGDLDGDGHLDVMVTNFNEGNTVWTNDGTGAFTDSDQSLGNRYSMSVALGDFDGDGDLDAMVGNNGQPNIVWVNDGTDTGTFTDSGQALGNSKSFSVALGDLDADGDIDAMVANENQPNTVWINEASNISAVYNENSELWFDSVGEAISMAAADDTLLIGGASFDVPGIIDARSLPLNFSARAPVEFGADLLFMASDGSSFRDWSGNGAGYDIAGRVIAPESGSLIFSDLDVLSGGELLQNDAFLIGYSDITNTAGTCYLKGELSAESTATGSDGVNYVAADTNVFGDYVNAGSTIIQRGILYIYGDLTNTGTMTGDFNNGFLRGAGPEEGDGYSIGGAYTIGAEASLVLPESLWRLSVGGNLDIAIDDPARFAMAQATIELTGLAPGNQQTLETLSADLGASDIGFASSNFPIGTLRVASGSNTVLANAHVNSTDTPCEVLYVDRLVVEAGASLTTAGCRIYTNEAVINGSVDNDDDIIVINDCPADIDGDGVVNGPDLAAVLAAWGSSTPVADFNGDGQVDGQDLAVILAAWGSCTE